MKTQSNQVRKNSSTNHTSQQADDAWSDLEVNVARAVALLNILNDKLECLCENDKSRLAAGANYLIGDVSSSLEDSFDAVFHIEHTQTDPRN